MENNLQILTTTTLAIMLLERSVKKAEILCATKFDKYYGSLVPMFKTLLFENILDGKSQTSLYKNLDEIFSTYKVSVKRYKPINKNDIIEYKINFDNVPEDIVKSLKSLEGRINKELQAEARRRNKLKDNLNNTF